MILIYRINCYPRHLLKKQKSYRPVNNCKTAYSSQEYEEKKHDFLANFGGKN